MTRSLLVVLVASTLVLAGCSKKSSNPVTPAPTPAANVAFTMHMESGTQGMIFVASPSMDIMLTKVSVAYPPAQFAETMDNPNPATVFAKGSNIQIGEYTGVDARQKWTLVFVGTVAATGQPFVTTMEWEVI